MASFQFSLVAPGRVVLSAQVEHVVVPGVEGEFGVLAEVAVPVEEVDRARLAMRIKDAQEDVADLAEGPARDKARELLQQLQALEAALGH